MQTAFFLTFLIFGFNECLLPVSHLQHLDTPWSDEETHSNPDERQADEQEARDDNACREHRLPSRKPLLRESSVARPVRVVPLFLHGCPVKTHVHNYFIIFNFTKC